MTVMFYLPASRLLSRNALRSLSISSSPSSLSFHASVLRSSFSSRAAATSQTTALRSLVRQTQPASTTSPFFLLLRPQHVQVRALRTSREPSLPTAHKTPLAPAAKSLRERVWAAGQLSDLQEPPAMSTLQRLLRPALFTLVVVAGSLYYAYNYRTPSPSERWFPTVPIAFATVASLIGLNLAVFVAWKIPLPVTWRVLNRYFVSVSAIPRAASMLGAAFSHQELFHLGVNMCVLYSLGTSLCEQIGAGPFVGLYLSGAVVSSLASLAWNVHCRRFAVLSLGASGAISTVVGTYAYINPDSRLYIIFLPFLALKAKMVVSAVAVLEMVGIARGWAVLDHMAHLSGLVWGVVGGWALMAEYRRRLEKRRKELSGRWP